MEQAHATFRNSQVFCMFQKLQKKMSRVSRNMEDLKEMKTINSQMQESKQIPSKRSLNKVYQEYWHQISPGKQCRQDEHMKTSIKTLKMNCQPRILCPAKYVTKMKVRQKHQIHQSWKNSSVAAQARFPPPPSQRAEWVEAAAGSAVPQPSPAAAQRPPASLPRRRDELQESAGYSGLKAEAEKRNIWKSQSLSRKLL